MEETNSEKPIDLLVIEPIMQDLARFIIEDNIDAEISFEELQKNVSGTAYREEMQVLSESISNYDFETAKSSLQKMAVKMNVNLGE